MHPAPHLFTIGMGRSPSHTVGRPSLALHRLALPAFLLLSLAAHAATPPEEIAAQAPAARAILDGWQAQASERSERTLHLVYWTPADREPAPRYRERLSRIFQETRDFYAREMERNGFGPRTIRLVQEADGFCKIHLVRGTEAYAHYSGRSGSEIRRECVPVLRAAGLDPDKETIVIFCNMANWDAEKGTMTQNSPYYASGTNRSGTAWQVDSPLLDLDLLDDREPMIQDGQYGRISVGRYNSIFIGGVIHELGHALGLPHCRARPDQAALWGAALMGAGNRTYGEQTRGEGKGTFLTFAEAVRLASHPMFCGSVRGFDTKANAQLRDVKIVPQGRTFTFSARVVADPPAYAVIGYTDPAGGSNYDATTCTAVPDTNGAFTLECNALTAGKAGMLHVVVAQANGAMSSFASFGGERQFPYFVEKDGVVDLTASLAKEKLAPLVAALEHQRADEAALAVRELESSGVDPNLLAVARVLAATLEPPDRIAPADAAGPTCALSDAATAEVSVGYGRPVANRLPEASPLLQAGSRLFARGLYAHAPARHAWALGGKWSRLTGTAGLADGHDGTVVFSIVADGRELWHSPRTQPGALVPFDVDVKDVQRLDLQVTDAGDGNSRDWGLWLEPTLTR